MNQIQKINSQPSSTQLNRELSYLENIVDKKVKGIGLSCIESFVDWFLRTFSCCYPAYDRLYKDKAEEQLGVNTRQMRVQPISPPPSPPSASRTEEISGSAQSRLPAANGTPTSNAQTLKTAIEETPSEEPASPIDSEPVQDISQIKEEQPRITPLRKGEFHDFTSGTRNIARIETTERFQQLELQYSTSKKYYKVVLCYDNGNFDTSFNLKNNTDKIILKEYPNNAYILEKYTGASSHIKQTYSINRERLYRNIASNEPVFLAKESMNTRVYHLFEED